MEAPESKVERRTHHEEELEDDGQPQEHDPSYEEDPLEAGGQGGEAAEEEEDQGLEDKLQRLNLMLQQATAYSQFISQRIRLPGLPNQLPSGAVPAASTASRGSSSSSSSTSSTKGRPTTPHKNKNQGKRGKRPRSERSEEQQTEEGAGKGEEEEGEGEGEEANKQSEQNGGKRKRQKTDAIGQPEMLTGGALRDYQLTGVAWLASLYENGINGILADEMGLGKTIQTVAFLTYLYAKGVKGPFLVVGPLSTLANWVKEIQKWAPAMPVLLYHGTKDERIELRKKALPAIVSSKQGIVVTSFEITIKDRSALQRKRWKYIILDEGHRIKNMNCRLVKELKAYDSANRLLLTGTPLQNNLAELWSLLSFLMPSIFDDLEAFQRWFNFEGVGREEGNRRILTAERENQLVTKLHTILQPFLLRRVKTDVEMDLPKKEERIINTILTPAQQRLYQATLNRQLHELLATSKAKARCQRGTGLQNLIMQLRKCCNHPYLFEWPVDDQGEEVVDERLVEASGKLQMLDRLLPRLRAEGHRVLLFSQMTRMLDILEDYMHLRQFPFFRLDGTTPQPERQAQIEEFNNTTPTTTTTTNGNNGNNSYTAGTDGSGAFCFLLSTRAGGLGINLTAANVVVFVDSDWNPQMDLQAQDRAHRIGQTRNVRVYRLVTGNSIEAKIVERAAHKMKLGALVLAGTAHAHTTTAAASATDDDKLDELSDLLHDSTLLQPLTEPPPITDELLFDWD